MSTTALAESYWPADGSEPLLEVTVGGLLAATAAKHPDRIALIDGQPDPADRRQWTYQELDALADRVARALLERFDPGDRIAIWAPNMGEWVMIQQGLARAGLVMVALNPNYRRKELLYVLGQSRAVGLFHTDAYRGFDMAGLVEELRPELPHLEHVVSFTRWTDFLDAGSAERQLPRIDPRDPLQIQYTSGTTGFPKGALLCHQGVVNACVFPLQRAQVQDGSVFVNAMPMYHIGGGSVTELGTFGLAGTYVLMPDFDPGLLLELVEAYGGTHTLVVPTMLMALLDHPDRPSRQLATLEVIMSGAATVPASLVARTKDTLDCRMVISFGQTEMSGVISQTEVTDSPQDQSETIGRPLPQVEVRIIDPEDGNTAAIGEQGEICIRGYQAMLGYFELAEETAAAIDPDGWLHSGDLGSMDTRGFLRITGRLKDMIIRGGLNVYPREIEEVLLSHPAVADAAVVGVPDEQWGEEVAAVIRPADPDALPNPVELEELCRQQIASFKRPKLWYSTGEYPMTPTGKIQKFLLQDQIVGGDLREMLDDG